MNITNSESRKPNVFIGSSSASLRIANQVAYALQDIGRPKVWKNGVFGLGWGTLESLLAALDKHDYAVLVLSPDDRVSVNDLEQSSPRDNVIFELGLFMGRLGRDRTFVLFDKSANLKLLSDLAGITVAEYDGIWARDDLAAAIGTACHPIQEAIRRPRPSAAPSITAPAEGDAKDGAPTIFRFKDYRPIAEEARAEVWLLHPRPPLEYAHFIPIVARNLGRGVRYVYFVPYSYDFAADLRELFSKLSAHLGDESLARDMVSVQQTDAAIVPSSAVIIDPTSPYERGFVFLDGGIGSADHWIEMPKDQVARYAREIRATVFTHSPGQGQPSRAPHELATTAYASSLHIHEPSAKTDVAIHRNRYPRPAIAALVDAGLLKPGHVLHLQDYKQLLRHVPPEARTAVFHDAGHAGIEWRKDRQRYSINSLSVKIFNELAGVKLPINATNLWVMEGQTVNLFDLAAQIPKSARQPDLEKGRKSESPAALPSIAIHSAAIYSGKNDAQAMWRVDLRLYFASDPGRKVVLPFHDSKCELVVGGRIMLPGVRLASAGPRERTSTIELSPEQIVLEGSGPAPVLATGPAALPRPLISDMASITIRFRVADTGQVLTASISIPDGTIHNGSLGGVGYDLIWSTEYHPEVLG